METLFPHLCFSVDDEFIPDLDAVISTEPVIVLKQTYHCYCYDLEPRTTDYIPIVNDGSGITYRAIFTQLDQLGYDPQCNHRFLEGITQITAVQYELCFGS